MLKQLRPEALMRSGATRQNGVDFLEIARQLIGARRE